MTEELEKACEKFGLDDYKIITRLSMHGKISHINVSKDFMEIYYSTGKLFKANVIKIPSSRINPETLEVTEKMICYKVENYKKNEHYSRPSSASKKPNLQQYEKDIRGF